MNRYFIQDERLGIPIPYIKDKWDSYPKNIQEEILFNWEKIRGKIPDRIASLENSINNKQEELNIEEDFQRSCKLNLEISELASVINDLWIWYRVHQDITEKMHH